MWVLLAWNDYGPYEGCSEPVVIAVYHQYDILWNYAEDNRSEIILNNKDLLESCVVFSVQKANVLPD